VGANLSNSNCRRTSCIALWGRRLLTAGLLAAASLAQSQVAPIVPAMAAGAVAPLLIPLVLLLVFQTDASRNAEKAVASNSWPWVEKIASAELRKRAKEREEQAAQESSTGEAWRSEQRWLLMRAYARQRMGRYAEALADYRSATDAVERAEFSVLLNRGICETVLGRWGEAEHLMMRLAEREPQHWEPQYNLGVIRSITGDEVGAQLALERLRPLNPAMAGSAFLVRDGALRAIVTFTSNRATREYQTIFFEPQSCDSRGAFVIGRLGYEKLEAPGTCAYARRLDTPGESNSEDVRKAYALARQLGARVASGWYEIHDHSVAYDLQQGGPGEFPLHTSRAGQLQEAEYLPTAGAGNHMRLEILAPLFVRCYCRELFPCLVELGEVLDRVFQLSGCLECAPRCDSQEVSACVLWLSINRLCLVEVAVGLVPLWARAPGRPRRPAISTSRRKFPSDCVDPSPAMRGDYNRSMQRTDRIAGPASRSTGFSLVDHSIAS